MTHFALRHGLTFSFLTLAALVLAACSPVGAGGAQPAPAAPATTAPVVAATATTAADVAAPSPTLAASSAPAATSPAAAIPAATAVAAPPASVAAVAATTAPTAAPTSATVAVVPVCTPDKLTPALTEGPYYKANPPQNSALQTPGMNGTRLTITGYVLDANCKPLPGARVDFWQADAAGQYDNQGYTLRGYQVTDAQGRYAVVTVVPGLYPGRTRHIHVKVTPAGGATLTTQVFFPNEAQNASDGIFAAQNVLRISNSTGGETASFDFVLKTG